MKHASAMEPSWKRRRTGLIDKYINLWKTIGFDFNSDTWKIQKDEPEPCDSETISFAATKINAELKENKYSAYNVLKIVYAEEKRFWIVKFTMRNFRSDDAKTVEAFILDAPSSYELLEWRFKDGPPETAPNPLLFPCVEILPVPESSSPSRLTNQFSALSTSGTPSPMVSDQDEDDFQFPTEDEYDPEVPYDEDEVEG